MKKGEKMSEEQKRKIVATRRKNCSYFFSRESRLKNRLSHLGKKHTEEQKRKISEANKKVIHTEEWNRKVGLANKGQIPWTKGKHLSEEHKRRISKSNLGKTISLEQRRKLSEFNKGRKSWNKGRHGIYSIETLKKMRDARKGKTPYVMTEEIRRKMSSSRPKGEKAWNWKGGTSKENKVIRRGIEFKFWREAVFKRDNWTCQKCLIKGGVLHPHHMLNFSEYDFLRFVIENGITLCETHHREFHKKYGLDNNSIGQIEEYIGRKLQ